jgi:Tol biopolymer transport system component
MTKHLIFIFIVACLVGSCSPVAPTAIQPATATVSPTIIPPPTRFTTPTITPYPPLQTQGPYLLFTQDNKILTMVDADGSGQKQITLPNDGYIFQLNKSVSPDGEWLAYFTGSTEEPYDITLNLLKLSDETTQSVSKLLTSDFPANLEPIVESMVVGDPPSYDPDCFQDMECRWSLIQRELTNSLFSFDWSPDSKSIAFTAQIDGSSSDIYIFSLQDKTIRPFTDEPENIYSLDLAPNGQGILYQISSPPGTAYEGSQWRLKNLDGKQIPFTEELSLEYFRWDGHEWISENLYLFLHFSDVEPSFSSFKILNTDTGQVKEVWPYTADFFVVNEQAKTILVTHKNHNNQIATVPDGIYMIDMSGNKNKISDWQLILSKGQGPYQILGQDYERQVYNIKNDGFIEALPWSGYPFPSISPDGSLLLYREYKKLALYTDSYEPLKSWPMEDENYTTTWSPGSLGIFIFTKLNVYSLSIEDDQPRPLVENCSLEYCQSASFVWLP